MRDHLGNKMQAPQARISKPNSDEDAERDPVSALVNSHLHESSKLTITGREAFDPQHNVQQKDDNKRSVKNVPQLSHA